MRSVAVKMSADDPLFLPHLDGERTPYFDPDMRGAWVGLSPRHDKSDLMRAALEGVAFAIREAVSVALDAMHVQELRLAGGGTVNRHWRQMLADCWPFRYALSRCRRPRGEGRRYWLAKRPACGPRTRRSRYSIQTPRTRNWTPSIEMCASTSSGTANTCASFRPSSSEAPHILATPRVTVVAQEDHQSSQMKMRTWRLRPTVIRI